MIRTRPALRPAVLTTAVLGVTAMVAAAGTAAAAVRTTVPVDPDRETARSWAAQELAGREYQQARPGLLARAASWLWDQLDRLPTFTGTGSRIGLLVVVLLASGAVIFAVQRSGGLRRQARTTGGGVFTDPALTAARHREAAQAAERAEDWAAAVVERFRAITRELEERAVIVPHPGRTADEVAAEAGGWLPSLAERLRAAAGTFDDVRYGERPGSPSAATALRELDDAVRRARPVAQAVAQTGGLVAPS